MATITGAEVFEGVRVIVNGIEYEIFSIDEEDRWGRFAAIDDEIHSDFAMEISDDDVFELSENID